MKTTIENLQSRIDNLHAAIDSAVYKIKNGRADCAKDGLCEAMKYDHLAAKEAEKCPVCGSTTKIDGGEACGQCGEDLPSVAGRMEMTHADFEHACQVVIGEEQQKINPDNHLIGLLCEAVRCSRECCEPATAEKMAKGTLDQTAVVEAAIEFESLLSILASPTDDWPIKITADNAEYANELAQRLNNLCNAIKDMKSQAEQSTVGLPPIDPTKIYTIDSSEVKQLKEISNKISTLIDLATRIRMNQP